MNQTNRRVVTFNPIYSIFTYPLSPISFDMKTDFNFEKKINISSFEFYCHPSKLVEHVFGYNGTELPIYFASPQAIAKSNDSLKTETTNIVFQNTKPVGIKENVDAVPYGATLEFAQHYPLLSENLSPKSIETYFQFGVAIAKAKAYQPRQLKDLYGEQIKDWKTQKIKDIFLRKEQI